MEYPFPFPGHGEASTRTLRVWLVARDSEVSERLAAECSSLAPTATIRHDGPLLEIRSTKDAAKLLAWLEELKDVALVVRSARVKGSAWHRASLRDPRLFEVLATVLRAAPEYLSPHGTFLFGTQDVITLMFEAIEGRAPRAEVLAAVLRVLLDTAPGKARAVLMDQLLEQLPALMGFDFDADVVLRHTLAGLLKKSPHSISVPPQFAEALAHRLGTRLSAVTEHPPLVGDLDWADVGAVGAAIRYGEFELLGHLDEAEESHARTLLELPSETLRALAMSSTAMATRIANVAALRLPRGLFAEALQLFDAAVEGELMAGAAANPLFAVQDDNHHLGLDEARARRYLERLLPMGPENPTVFLNASFVFMELGEPDRAMAMLGEAKARGLKVKQHRNEGLFAPLRDRADFNALMKL